jgi:hypothetical protein
MMSHVFGNCGHLLGGLWTPEMEAIGMMVDVVRFCRVQLHDNFIVAEKQLLDVTHLMPVGTAVQKTHRNVVPTKAVTGNDQQTDLMEWNPESSPGRARTALDTKRLDEKIWMMSHGGCPRFCLIARQDGTMGRPRDIPGAGLLGLG